MFTLDSITNENNKEHNKKWSFIPDHSYRILIIGGIDKICLYAKDLSELKHEFLIRKWQDVGIKHLNDSNAFIECSNTIDDVYENIADYNPNTKRKISFVFDQMISGFMANKKFQAIIKELFIRCRKLNILFVFITQSYFSVPKDVRLNSTYCLIIKINNRKKLQNIAINYDGDIDYNDFVNIYRICTKKPESFLTIDALPACNPLRFRKNFVPFYKNSSS